MATFDPARCVAIVGCGYVGCALGRALVEAGCHVRGTTTTPGRVEELRAGGMEPALLDLRESSRLHDLLQDRDACYLTVAPGSRSRDYREVYLDGARALADAIVGTPVRRVVYTSSTRVYGQEDGRWVDEDSPTEPADANGQALLEAERILLALGHAAASGVRVTVLRLAGIYGPGRDFRARITARAGEARTDGDEFLNLIHVDDVAAVLAKLLSVEHHGVFTLADHEPLLRRELYDAVLRQAGQPPIRWMPPAVPPPRGKRVRNQRIKDALNLTLRYPRSLAFLGHPTP